jgi:isochorismate synthase
MTSGDFFEAIQNHYNDELPFVAYRKPNGLELKSIFQKDVIVHYASDFTESGFVFAPFDNTEKAILIPNEFSKSVKLDSVLLNASEETLPIVSKPSENQKQFHLKLVEKTIDKINQSELQKIVVSRNEEVTIQDTNPIAVFKKLLNKYETAFVYCWFHPKVGLWLGATPETLLKIEGNRLSTMSLAGTQNYINTEDVVWQDKEKNEQQLVTDFIVGSLKSSVVSPQSAVGSMQSAVKEIQVSKTKTLRAGSLLHLKTDIIAIVKPETLNLKQILHNLHPTPAICGLPKEKAKQFILQNENYNRDYYSGFLGELNFKEKTTRNSNRRNVENNAYATIKRVSNLYVNLRCMQLKGNTAIIYIGGGITKDSNPEMEWEETVSKSEVIKSIL